MNGSAPTDTEDETLALTITEFKPEMLLLEQLDVTTTDDNGVPTMSASGGGLL